MRLKPSLFFCSAILSVSLLHAQVTPPLEVKPDAAKEASTPSGKKDGPSKAAFDAFAAGDHAKGVELATPLAQAGDADALHILGFANETGQGAPQSIEKALEFYTKAAAAGQKDSLYRLAYIKLASDKEEDRNQARESLEKAAKTDPAIAGRVLGEAWLRGRLSKEPDFDKALQWWLIAADTNDVPSIVLVAKAYDGQFGFPEKRDLKKATEAWRKAADLGDPNAMTAIGSRLLNGAPEIRNEKEGREWIKKAIEAKQYNGYLALGDFEENVKKDLKAALTAYEKGKDAGDLDCAVRTAEFYLNGKGVEKDADRGVNLLETAAKGGSAPAHLRLAAMGFAGEKPDLLVGYSHLLSAATGGIPEAQNELALLYLSGKLGSADAPGAAAWFGRAAQGGYAPAQNNLATLFERGAGVSQNIQTAGQLYAAAAQKGHGPATLALARLHAQGNGIAVNFPKSWALATIAGERGEKDADTLLKQLNEKMDDKQKAEAKKELETIRGSSPAPAKDAAPAPAPAPAKPAPKK